MWTYVWTFICTRMCGPIEGCELSGNTVQSNLTYPHTSVLDEIADKVRELDK